MDHTGAVELAGAGAILVLGITLVFVATAIGSHCWVMPGHMLRSLGCQN